MARLLCRSNPFEDEPLPAAHYHPSLQKHLSDAEKKINLSPGRLPKHDAVGTSASPGREERPSESEKPSPAEKEFLARTNAVLARELPTRDTPSPGDASSRFDESWPTSERPSTIESPAGYQELGVFGSSRSTPGTDSLAQWRNRYNKEEGGRPGQQNPPAEGSTLAKYIQRFRYSEPKSRPEREREKRAAGVGDFWWLAPAPPSRTSTPSAGGGGNDWRATPRGAGSHEGERGGRAGRGWRGPAGSCGGSASPISAAERMDTDTDDLQTRAEWLLERSESTVLSEPAVSSDGVGVSSAASSRREPDYLVGDVPPTLGAGHRPGGKAGPRPEDDILHRWRVRRRLEEARRRAARPPTDASRGADLEQQTVDGSCLDDFRKRLKQHELLSKSRPGAQPTEPPKPLTKTTGTSPMPQTAATQTRGAPPSVGEDVPVRDPGTGTTSDGPVPTPRSQHLHDLCDIRAGHAEAADYQSGANYRGRPRASEVDERERRPESIVASPSVRPAASCVVPHLHMACDIVPCPTDRRPDQALRRDGGGRIGGGLVAEAHERPATGVPRATVTGQPASQRPAPSGEDLPPRGSASDRQERPSEKSARDVSEPSSVAGPSQAAKPTAKSRSDDDGDDDDRIPRRQKLDFEEREATPRPQGPVEELDGEAEWESPIGAAVGQVICDRLFTTPDRSGRSTPTPSVDSLPSMHSSVMSRRSGPGQGRLQGDAAASSSASSDGEEFAEDELLQLLRRRRSQFESQLQGLELLIERRTATDTT